MYEDFREYFMEELAREPEERDDSTNQIIKSLEGLAKYQPALENGVKTLAKGVERLWAQAEPGLNDVAGMAASLMKAAKTVEDSGVLEPVEALIFKAHECLARPLDAFGGLSPCEALSAFQKRAEDELEKIIAMLNAYYYHPLVYPSRSMETAVIASAAGAVAQNPSLSPGEKPACPHVSQGVFPHYCDAQGRCHLDFPPEYRHSDIHLEGDPAMKNSLSALCLACVLLATPACKYNDEPEEHYDLARATLAFYNDEMSDEELLKFCNRVLGENVAGDAKFFEMLYASRSLMFLEEGDYDRAEKDARRAVTVAPKDSNEGWLTLATVLAERGKMSEAADAMEQMLDNPNLLPGQADKYRKYAADYREAAKVMSPGELDAKFAADEQSAEKKVAGAQFTLHGEIKYLDFDTYKEPMIAFEGSAPERIVACYFRADTQDRYSHLKPGQTVTVIGLCDGMSQGELVIAYCRLISVAP